MNHDPVSERLRELNWRRPLTDAELAELRAYLAGHPEAKADWDAEVELSALVNQLPNAPVPSNFTARVLQAIECEARAETRAREPRAVWWWRVFVPRTAAVLAVAGLGWFAYQQHRAAQRAEFLHTLATSMPGPETLQDFEVIRRLSPAAEADEELLALNQELLALKQ